MTTFIVANWKMNPSTKEEAVSLLLAMEKLGKENKKVIICPPFPFMSLSKNVILGAQNCFFEKEGPFTGEVSPYMLKSLGCNYVIVGHSERRNFFQEDSSLIRKKIEVLNDAKMTTILCVGEKSREDSDVVETITRQIESVLDGVSLQNIIIAYEPVFAIGTGDSCSAEIAKERRELIKEVLFEIDKNENPAILYGGSVDSNNVSEYIDKAGFDGVLVGGASLNKDEFKKIVDSV